jgi:hypothetical protein
MANKAYQFPQGEPNPFAEPTPQNAPDGSANPFAVSGEPVRSVDPGPGAYQQTLPQRSGTVLVFAIVGLVGAVLALPLAFCLVPLGVFSMMASIPALLMARQDLAAMRAGAMEGSQKGALSAAHIFAIVGIVLGLLSLAICVGLYVLVALSD